MDHEVSPSQSTTSIRRDMAGLRWSNFFFFFKTIYIPGQYIVQDRSRDQRKRNYGTVDARKQSQYKRSQTLTEGLRGVGTGGVKHGV